MSFQAYLDNIKAKTPAGFKKIAEKNKLLTSGTKAGEIVAWLKKDFELGHGHAMALYAVLKPSIQSQSDENKIEKNNVSSARRK